MPSQARGASPARSPAQEVHARELVVAVSVVVNPVLVESALSVLSFLDSETEHPTREVLHKHRKTKEEIAARVIGHSPSVVSGLVNRWRNDFPPG